MSWCVEQHKRQYLHWGVSDRRMNTTLPAINFTYILYSKIVKKKWYVWWEDHHTKEGRLFEELRRKNQIEDKDVRVDEEGQCGEAEGRRWMVKSWGGEGGQGWMPPALIAPPPSRVSMAATSKPKAEVGLDNRCSAPTSHAMNFHGKNKQEEHSEG